MIFYTFSGVPLNLDFCPYNIQIFPMQQMEGQYIMSKPIHYTVAVLLTFLFTVLILALLSYLQECSHKIVLETAVQSSAIVLSLFSAVVRERLFAGGNSGTKGDTYKAASAKNHLKKFLTKGTSRQVSIPNPLPISFPAPQPCSQIFPDS
jgi:hypothetical protein